MYRFLTTTLCALLFGAATQAQKPIQFDSSYIQDKSGDLLLRVYGSNKFTQLTLGDYHYTERLVYKPNTNYNVGLGFNYRWLGINIGFKGPGINNDDDRRGKSKWLDLQAYIYMRKLTIDFYGQSFEGYYLANNSLLRNEPVGRDYFLRNDIQTRNLGANVEYIFNNKQFSYRAVYVQNERQLKSAGSFIAGAGLHYHHTRADSSLKPDDQRFAVYGDNMDYQRSGIASLTINGGYAHTFVIAQSFFITGSAQLGAGANYAHRENDASVNNQAFESNSVGLQLNGIARLGGGYNGPRFFAGIYYVTNLEASNLSAGGTYQMYETGMLRLAVARRINAPKKVARTFDRLEGLFK